MSIPQTGQFEAKADVWSLFFDGNNWTGDGPGFEEFILPRLQSKTSRYKHTHSTCDTVATRVLNELFPEGWTKIYSRSDPSTYKGRPPPGWTD